MSGVAGTLRPITVEDCDISRSGPSYKSLQSRVYALASVVVTPSVTGGFRLVARKNLPIPTCENRWLASSASASPYSKSENRH